MPDANIALPTIRGYVTHGSALQFSLSIYFNREDVTKLGVGSLGSQGPRGPVVLETRLNGCTVASVPAFLSMSPAQINSRETSYDQLPFDIQDWGIHAPGPRGRETSRYSCHLRLNTRELYRRPNTWTLGGSATVGIMNKAGVIIGRHVCRAKLHESHCYPSCSAIHRDSSPLANSVICAMKLSKAKL